MSGSRLLLDGQYARHEGDLYFGQNWPPGSMTLRKESLGEVVKVAPIGDLQEWYKITFVCTFLGHEFLIVDEADETYRLSYPGGPDDWALKTWADAEKYPEVKFQRDDQYSLSAVVPKVMVENLHEVKEDRLTPWRKAEAERERRKKEQNP